MHLDLISSDRTLWPYIVFCANLTENTLNIRIESHRPSCLSQPDFWLAAPYSKKNWTVPFRETELTLIQYLHTNRSSPTKICRLRKEIDILPEKRLSATLRC